MCSRNPKDLDAQTYDKFNRFDAKMKAAGIPYVITCTSRSLDEQTALYSQGRNDLATTNKLRAAAGMTPITFVENTRKVTWTMDSKHIVGNGKRTKAEAFDIAILSGGNATWDVKADVNHDQIPDYQQAGAIAAQCGLKWGGTFKSPDLPHFENDTSKP